MSNEYNDAVDSQYRSFIARCDMLDLNITKCEALLAEFVDSDYKLFLVTQKRLEYYNQLMGEFGSINSGFNLLMGVTSHRPCNAHQQSIIDVMFNRFNNKMDALLDRLRIFSGNNPE